jgi:hypothetical protein
MFNDGGNVYFAGQSSTLPYIYFVRVQHSTYNTKYFSGHGNYAIISSILIFNICLMYLSKLLAHEVGYQQSSAVFSIHVLGLCSPAGLNRPFTQS